MSGTIVTVGQVARDLVLRVDHVPGDHEAVAATERVEVLGGKGANQAVALAQLGMPVALLGVVGEDDHVLEQARADGIDVTPVVRRAAPRPGSSSTWSTGTGTGTTSSTCRPRCC